LAFALILVRLAKEATGVKGGVGIGVGDISGILRRDVPAETRYAQEEIMCSGSEGYDVGDWPLVEVVDVDEQIGEVGRWEEAGVWTRDRKDCRRAAPRVDDID
jgi:hypothetical protein